jgi:hypothetical protein
MHRNQRHLVVSLLVLLVVALVSAAGFVGCGWRLPVEHDDPTVLGPNRHIEVVATHP